MQVTPTADLGFLDKYMKSTVTNIGVKIDSDLKFDQT